jgi:hypothetical protein
VLAGVSGIGGECFSWMGGGQQCGDRVAAHLGAGRAGGDTTRMCQWSGTALWPAGTGGSAEARTAIGSCLARRAVGVALVLLVAGEPG